MYPESDHIFLSSLWSPRAMGQLKCRGFCEPDHSASYQAACARRGTLHPNAPRDSSPAHADGGSFRSREIAYRTIRAIEGWADEAQQRLPTTGLIQRARPALLRDFDQLRSAISTGKLPEVLDLRAPKVTSVGPLAELPDVRAPVGAAGWRPPKCGRRARRSAGRTRSSLRR
jgi:hypothetical protein